MGRCKQEELGCERPEDWDKWRDITVNALQSGYTPALALTLLLLLLLNGV